MIAAFFSTTKSVKLTRAVLFWFKGCETGSDLSKNDLLLITCFAVSQLPPAPMPLILYLHNYARNRFILFLINSAKNFHAKPKYRLSQEKVTLSNLKTFLF